MRTMHLQVEQQADHAADDHDVRHDDDGRDLPHTLRPPGASCGGCGGSCGARSPAATREVRFRRLGVASSAFDISLGLWRIFVECARH